MGVSPHMALRSSAEPAGYVAGEESVKSWNVGEFSPHLPSGNFSHASVRVM